MAFVTKTVDGITFDIPRNSYTFTPAGDTFHVATTGDDDTGDGSAGNPWASVRKAILSGLGSGDLVYIHAGTYEEGADADGSCLRCAFSGSSDNPIVIAAFPGDEEAVFIKPAHQWYIRPGNINRPIFELRGSYITLYGLDISGYMGLPDAPTVFTQRNQAVCVMFQSDLNERRGQQVINCTLHRGQHGCIKSYGSTARNWLIEGCILRCLYTEANDNNHCVYIADDGSVGGIIRGCVGLDSPGYGLHVYEQPSDCYIYNNQMFRCQRDGYLVNYDSNLLAYNVSVTNRAGMRFYATNPDNNQFLNNVVTDNSQADSGPAYESIRANTPGGTNNLVDYNYLVSRAGTWKTGSGIVDGGHNLTATPETTDPGFESWNKGAGTYRCKLTSGVGLNAAMPIALPDMTLYPPNLGIFDASYYDPSAPPPPATPEDDTGQARFFRRMRKG